MSAQVADAQSPSKPVTPSNSYDSAKRRRSKRAGRERGCWLYVPADELVKAKIDPSDPPPFYRVWGSSRGGLFVRLYKEA